jgi:hypothetical protein
MRKDSYRAIDEDMKEVAGSKATSDGGRSVTLERDCKASSYLGRTYTPSTALGLDGIMQLEHQQAIPVSLTRLLSCLSLC